MLFLMAVGGMALFILTWAYFLLREEKKKEQKMRTA